ncbi:MAG TPA: lipopolysaccharide transport periplasmic protein LptA [Casimicrobiaceae bacterium]
MPRTLRGRIATPALCVALAFCVALALAAAPAHAEKADRDKPINFSAEQPAQVDFQKRVGTLRGNVIITQGTLSIHADRIDFKQNPDNSLSATAYGNPVSFRQKKDGSDEYFEGYAQKAVYNGETRTLELFDRALLKQGSDEIRSNYISYNEATGIFRAEGRPDTAGAEGPGARVRGVFQPRPEGGAAKGTIAPGAAAAPGAATTGKPAAPAGAASTSAAPAAAAPAPPLTLTPDTRPPAK